MFAGIDGAGHVVPTRSPMPVACWSVRVNRFCDDLCLCVACLYQCAKVHTLFYGLLARVYGLKRRETGGGLMHAGIATPYPAILAHKLYTTNVARPTMGETFPVRTPWGVERMTRDGIREFLAALGPCGLNYVYHTLNVHMMNNRDFEAACDHFGVRHLLVEITDSDVKDEMEARRARAEPASTGPMLLMMEVLGREEADARIAIYNRRVADAEAKMATPATA